MPRNTAPILSKRKERIGKSFGQKVTSYNRHAILQKNTAQTLCDFLPDLDAPKILEIGCGTGFLTENLQKKYPKSSITALDISREMVVACRQKFMGFQNIDFDYADAEHFESDDKFDLIVSNLSVQWFDDPMQGLNNLKNNLNEDGTIFYTTLAHNSFWQWRDILDELNLSSGILDHPNYDGIFECEEKIIQYQNAIDFLQNLKKIGAHQSRESHQPLSHKELKKACALFDEKHDGNITWKILYGQL